MLPFGSGEAAGQGKGGAAPSAQPSAAHPPPCPCLAALSAVWVPTLPLPRLRSDATRLYVLYVRTFPPRAAVYVGLGFAVFGFIVLLELFGSPFMRNCEVGVAGREGLLVVWLSCAARLTLPAQQQGGWELLPALPPACPPACLHSACLPALCHPPICACRPLLPTPNRW